MANDVKLNSERFSSLRASQYAKLEAGTLQVRGSAFPDPDGPAWPYNTFAPDEFRALARYMLELADDAEVNRAVAEELAEDLIGVFTDAGASAPDAVLSYGDLARSLVQKGYHK